MVLNGVKKYGRRKASKKKTKIGHHLTWCLLVSKNQKENENWSPPDMVLIGDRKSKGEIEKENFVTIGHGGWW